MALLLRRFASEAPLKAYASRTGSRRTLEALRSHRWGLFVSATGVLRTEGFSTYALDNGAWTAYQRGRPFDERSFLRAVDLLGAGAQFVVVPDIVCGGLASLRLSERWLPRLEGVGRRRLIAVQNGMTPTDVRHLLSAEVGIFVGGDSAWKESTSRFGGSSPRRPALTSMSAASIPFVASASVIRPAPRRLTGRASPASRRRSGSWTKLAGEFLLSFRLGRDRGAATYSSGSTIHLARSSRISLANSAAHLSQARLLDKRGDCKARWLPIEPLGRKRACQPLTTSRPTFSAAPVR